jgi:hypothetical protein
MRGKKRVKREAMIVLNAGGTDERKVKVSEIAIPDLWCIARRRGPDTREGKTILEAWHLCHALKRYIMDRMGR